MPSDQMTDTVLAHAARRAARSANPLIAGLIKAWSAAFPDRRAGDELATSPRSLDELALCLRPRADYWLEDASAVAEALGIEADRLISFLRAAEAAERFAVAQRADHAQAGRLLAARDHDEET